MDGSNGAAALTTVAIAVIGLIAHIMWYSARATSRQRPRRTTVQPAPRRTTGEPVLGAHTEAGRRLQAQTLRTRQEPGSPLRGSGPNYIRVNAEPEDAVPPGFTPRRHH